MYGARADAVNNAMYEIERDVFPRVVASGADPGLQQYAGVLKFSSDASGAPLIEWVVDPDTPMDKFTWPGIDNNLFNGQTPTGAAIMEVAKRVGGGAHGDIDIDSLAPSILLISDGIPNGKNPTYEEALEAAKQIDMFNQANRIAVGVDVDANGKASLEKFGRLSGSLKEQFKPYMDVADEMDAIVEIIKRLTEGLSIQR